MIEIDAKQVSEDIVAEGVAVAHKYVGQLCDMIDELRGKCGVEKEIPEIESIDPIADDIRPLVTGKLSDVYQIKSKADRSAAIKELKTEIAPQFCEGEGESDPKCSKTTFNRAFDKVEKEVVRKLIMEGKRPDGRAYDQVRDIDCEIGLLPRSHGSALFTRGETQALVSVTLGTGRDEQTVDGLLDEFGQDFMLHYNFPPFSVGEVRFIRGPGRREIGHGVLAEKALEQVKPEKEDFPYTIKIVSDITESNGSSSQASICGGTLAMMAA